MPAGLQAPRSIDDLLLYRIARLLAVAGSPVVRLCEGGYGITRREWRVIAVLARQQGLISSQLAERAQLDRARTSRAITSLAAKGLVRRDRGTGDRRQALVRITPQGLALYEALFPQVAAINQRLLSALPTGDVDRLDRALAALQEAAAHLVAESVDLPKADRRRGRQARPVAA
jgi:DNA-binding MarR family transcriptional regulator